MKRFVAVLTGLTSIMFHNERLANPRDPRTIELKKLTSQKKKTPELNEQISKLEWYAGLYESEGRVVIPADNILATLKQGARKRKLGKQAEAGVFSDVRFFPLDYDGPKEIDALWDDGRFFDYRGVKVQQARCMRARPRFDDWSVKIELFYDPEVLSKDDLIDALQDAGTLVGLCEKRPQFGRFSVEVIEADEEVKPTKKAKVAA
jgi:hypothetical protein